MILHESLTRVEGRDQEAKKKVQTMAKLYTPTTETLKVNYLQLKLGDLHSNAAKVVFKVKYGVII